MKMSRLFLSLVLLTAPLAAFAQDASNDARFADLRASMTAEEFKAIIANDVKTWGTIAREANISAE